jgi:hypothetical protein
MSDNETPEGMRLLYDLPVKASEFPGETPHNARNDKGGDLRPNGRETDPQW